MRPIGLAKGFAIYISYYSPWLFFACIALIWLFADSPLFAAADSPPSTGRKRIATVDGLRGLLALTVMFHHEAIYHAYVQKGIWEPPPSHFFTLIGPVAVAIFFMITGFLFWSQLLAKSGKPGWKALYIGRVFRIGPLYLLAVGTMFLIVAARTGFRLHEPFLVLLGQAASWLCLGLFPGPVTLNGYSRPGLLLADLTWTLRWEWFFYLSLPLLAFAARKRTRDFVFIFCALLLVKGFLHFTVDLGVAALSYVVLFLLGMLTASLLHADVRPKIPNVVGSGVIVLLLAFIFRYPHPVFSTMAQAAFGLLFYLVASGCSLFGLLTTRPAKRLGDVSYGIYLLQGLVLAALYRFTVCRQLELRSPLAHWAMGLVAAGVLVIVATVTHLLVENPSITWGKSLSALLARKTRS